MSNNETNQTTKVKQYRIVFTNGDGVEKHEDWNYFYPSELLERIDGALSSGFPNFRIEFRDEQ